MKDSFFKSFYQLIVDIASSLQSVFLLAIRLFWGSSFFFAGLGKLQNIQNTAEFFGNLGIPYPLFNAYAASIIECLGGACLFLGLGSRLAALGLMIVMLVALFTAHHDALIGALNDPQEFVTQIAFVYLLASSIVFVFGPGKLSLDYLIERLLKKNNSSPRS